MTTVLSNVLSNHFQQNELTITFNKINGNILKIWLIISTLPTTKIRYMYMLKHFRSCISVGVEQLCLLAELLQTRLRVGKNGEKTQMSDLFVAVSRKRWEIWVRLLTYYYIFIRIRTNGLWLVLISMTLNNLNNRNVTVIYWISLFFQSSLCKIEFR